MRPNKLLGRSICMYVWLLDKLHDISGRILVLTSPAAMLASGMFPVEESPYHAGVFNGAVQGL